MKHRMPVSREQLPGHGSPEILREVIAEDLLSVVLHAQHGCDYAALGNDRLLQLSIHHTVCCLRAVIATLNDLKARTAREVAHD
jgi:hypothetical protein